MTSIILISIGWDTTVGHSKTAAVVVSFLRNVSVSYISFSWESRAHLSRLQIRLQASANEPRPWRFECQLLLCLRLRCKEISCIFHLEETLTSCCQYSAHVLLREHLKRHCFDTTKASLHRALFEARLCSFHVYRADGPLFRLVFIMPGVATPAQAPPD